ncbi:hypothetical protein FB45DRAFT_788125 [Roridomyces roridus]|uniref:F-box domain-containing protein n=1 Tax=Roridomyces roridus TaxID=1738132 RepID=A0AAD7C5R0_9AGAR|nr:hypothetical protein FB45DRAFT_788125 [Roridomyces roridus]
MASKALRNEIDTLSRDISVLQALLKQKQSQLETIVYPTLSLPTEIISTIFIHCLPTKPSGPDSVNVREAPLLLMQVCSRWREIAVSTPELWTSLVIDANLRSDHTSDITTTWLQRSRSYPLSRMKIVGPIEQVKDFTVLTETFRRHARLFRSLELNLPCDSFNKLDAHRLDFPLLRELSILASAPPADADSLDTNIDMFSSVPLLEQLHMYILIPPVFVGLPWGQLRSFTGDAYGLPDCIEALILMPNLTECTFSVFHNIQGFNPGMFSHPGMRSFTLRQTVADGFAARSSEILEFVDFPNLQILHLLGVKEYEPSWSMGAFFQRATAMPHVKRLVINPQSPEQGSAELYTLSRPFSNPANTNLSELELWYPAEDLTRAFLEDMAEKDDFMRGLEKLSFRCQKSRRLTDAISPEALVEIAAAQIARRRTLEGVAKLGLFHVYAVDDSKVPMFLTEADLLPYKTLKTEGMDIYIGADSEDGHNLFELQYRV